MKVVVKALRKTIRMEKKQKIRKSFEDYFFAVLINELRKLKLFSK